MKLKGLIILLLLFLTPVFSTESFVVKASQSPQLTITNATMVEYSNSTLFSFTYNYTGLPQDTHSFMLPVPAPMNQTQQLALCTSGNQAFELYPVVFGYPNNALINLTYEGGYSTLSNTSVLTNYNLNTTAITRVYLQQQNDVMVMPDCTVSTAVSLATLQQEIRQLQDEVSNLTTAQNAILSNLTSIIERQNSILTTQIYNLTTTIERQNILLSNITSVVDIQLSNLTLANEKQAAQTYNLTSAINNLASKTSNIIEKQDQIYNLTSMENANLTSTIESQNSGLRLLVIAVLIVSLITLIIISKRS
jgi:hypothetical protein